MAKFELKWQGRKAAEGKDELAQFLMPGTVDPGLYQETIIKAYQEMNFPGCQSDFNGFWGERLKDICHNGYLGIPFPSFSELTLSDLLFYASKFWCELNKIEFDPEKQQILWGFWKAYYGQFMDQEYTSPERLQFLFRCNMSNASNDNPYLFGLGKAYDTHKEYGCENYKDSQHFLAGQIVAAISSQGNLIGATATERSLTILVILALVEKLYLPNTKGGYADAFNELMWGWFRKVLPLADPEDTTSGRGPDGDVPSFWSRGDWRLRFDWLDGNAFDHFGFAVLGEEILRS
ncbi:hypothetical protein FWF48_03225 [Candidatus Saccharibacteria bacterium]|nr:hypothetical protein [Candidatus Saccharibacteria bacterium]